MNTRLVKLLDLRACRLDLALVSGDNLVSFLDSLHGAGDVFFILLNAAFDHPLRLHVVTHALTVVLLGLDQILSRLLRLLDLHLRLLDDLLQGRKLALVGGVARLRQSCLVNRLPMKIVDWSFAREA